MLKLEDHVQLMGILPCIFESLIQRDIGHFPYGHNIVSGKDLPVHLMEKLVDPGSVLIIFRTDPSLPGDPVRKSRNLGVKVCHVHSESVAAHIQPELHHIIDLIAHLLIFPVQIRLLSGKQMKIILSCSLIKFPGRAGKIRSPVVRLLTVLGISPDVIVPVRIVLGFSGLHKPGMLI